MSYVMRNVFIAGLIAIASTSQSRGQTAQPAPTLERINQETQALFDTVKPGLVRVQLPVPKWLSQIGERDNPLNKWQLDPDVRAAIKAQQGQAGVGQVNVAIAPSTQPTTQPDEHWRLTMVQRPDGQIEFVSPSAAPSEGIIGALVAPRSLGIVYDDKGHIVIPVFVEKEAVDEQPSSLTVLSMAGGASKATFVGSDKQTNITVLKLENPLGRPAQFQGRKPADGSLVMLLAQDGNGGQLSIWARGQQDRGLVVDVTGHVTGFARMGQFLDAQLARPVIDQIIQYGRVRRATLGVLVTEAEAPDGRRAMHVDQVKPGSSAEVAGIREGDYILSVAGNPVDDLPNFAAAVSSSSGVTPLKVLRSGQVLELQVQLKQQ
jgi:hypothetical protein